ncbi:SDR family NAD(P)-dependent oxidoreductase [Algiphilus aromaticivorans]|uniref:SDR family NAD(P)-dependent oxidoreductase n=1 Tax=Algiphilus aromaticivorans TaxID=382454 RepID=UPI0005C23E2D|nr:SDR family NAD(P)-dependent oxidoreductase [Algiphilus aromaticivorans]
MQLTNKRVLITGAAAGLGRDFALRFATEGAVITVSDIDESGAQAVAAEIKAAGGQAHALRADVTVEADVARLVADAVAAMGGLDCLINNAGIETIKPVTDISEAEWDRLMAINVKGVFFGCKHAFPHLAETHGNIINLASAAGLIGWPLLSLYCASKGAVIQMSKALSQEFREAGVRVNALCPMVIATDMGSRFKDTYEKEYGVPAGDMLDARQGRLGRPEEVTAAAVFLASDGASFVNGVALPIDNGGTAG